jgi:hypothetical protein
MRAVALELALLGVAGISCTKGSNAPFNPVFVGGEGGSEIGGAAGLELSKGGVAGSSGRDPKNPDENTGGQDDAGRGGAGGNLGAGLNGQGGSPGTMKPRRGGTGGPAEPMD